MAEPLGRLGRVTTGSSGIVVDQDVMVVREAMWKPLSRSSSLLLALSPDSRRESRDPAAKQEQRSGFGDWCHFGLGAGNRWSGYAARGAERGSANKRQRVHNERRRRRLAGPEPDGEETVEQV